VGIDMAVGLDEIDLDARVHHHQHIEQLLHRRPVPLQFLHQIGMAGDMARQVPGQALQHFLLVARWPCPGRARR
jgi:hypothetical protein